MEAVYRLECWLGGACLTVDLRGLRICQVSCCNDTWTWTERIAIEAFSATEVYRQVSKDG